MNTSKSTQFRRILAATIFTVVASGVTTLTFAANSTDVLQEKVTYGDLNVSSPRGAATLYSRIRIAAQDVCRPLSGDSLFAKKMFQTCIDKAIAGAVNQVGEPALAAVFNAKYGTSKPIVLASQTR